MSKPVRHTTSKPWTPPSPEPLQMIYISRLDVSYQPPFRLKCFVRNKQLIQKFICQIETQIDISATSGTGETNSTDDNDVKGGLMSRNGFIAMGSPRWGAVLFGKTDAPYKLSTVLMNPFVANVGDYAAIMGNTGGDTRVEFGTRLDHSIWYTSRNFNKFEYDVLF